MADDYEIVEQFMADAREMVEELEYNENLSGYPELKIMFNAYGDGERGEGTDKNIESYYIFIHKDCLDDDFQFPEHELSRGTIIHRSDELCITSTYNVNEDYWDINFPELEDDPPFDEEQLSETLQELYQRYLS